MGTARNRGGGWGTAGLNRRERENYRKRALGLPTGGNGGAGGDQG